MGTRSTTKVVDESGYVLVNLYRQFDGYFEGHGQELQDFLKDFVIVNGFSPGTEGKVANGLGCLAAQLVAYFKKRIGGFYLVPASQQEEVNYKITLKDGKLQLIGKESYPGGLEKVFPLYEPIKSDNPKIVEFVYDKGDYAPPKWRKVEVDTEDANAIRGWENGEYKCFLKKKILDGRIFREIESD